MMLKRLMIFGVSAGLITACSTMPTKQSAKTKNTGAQPIIFTEPEVSPAFYALNPYNYSQPSKFEVNLYKASIAPVTKLQIPSDPQNPNSTPVVLDQNRFIIPLTDHNDEALKFAVMAQDNELDVTDIDDFLNLLEGKARHYPVHFASPRERDGFTDHLKKVMAQLDPLALKSNASYDVLARAAKASTIARNMDMGDQYGPKALSYAKRTFAMKPNDPQLSFWLGFGLAEGGAFKEAMPYLKTAMDANIQEAYLSMANAYIYMEQKKNAITTLKNYAVKFPTEQAVVDQLVSEIESGKRYNVWQVIK